MTTIFSSALAALLITTGTAQAQTSVVSVDPLFEALGGKPGIARLVAQPRVARNAPAQAAAAFSAEDVMQAQLGLRQTMGLGPEAFGAAQFIGMLGDEIRQLRDIGKSPAEIAALISKAIGRELPAALLEQHAPR